MGFGVNLVCSAVGGLTAGLLAGLISGWLLIRYQRSLRDKDLLLQVVNVIDDSLQAMRGGQWSQLCHNFFLPVIKRLTYQIVSRKREYKQIRAALFDLAEKPARYEAKATEIKDMIERVICADPFNLRSAIMRIPMTFERILRKAFLFASPRHWRSPFRK